MRWVSLSCIFCTLVYMAKQTKMNQRVRVTLTSRQNFTKCRPVECCRTERPRGATTPFHEDGNRGGLSSEGGIWHPWVLTTEFGTSCLYKYEFTYSVAYCVNRGVSVTTFLALTSTHTLTFHTHALISLAVAAYLLHSAFLSFLSSFPCLCYCWSIGLYTFCAASFSLFLCLSLLLPFSGLCWSLSPSVILFLPLLSIHASSSPCLCLTLPSRFLSLTDWPTYILPCWLSHSQLTPSPHSTLCFIPPPHTL